MAVLVVTDIVGSGPDDEVRWASLADRVRQRPGFVMEADGPTSGGWRVVSVWRSRRDFHRFYDSEIRPNLPPGIPERDLVCELRDVVLADAGVDGALRKTSTEEEG